MKRYNPSEIEPKWQKRWEDSKIFEVSEDAQKKKKYVIDMFPYPSGAAMHVGHVRNFTISDVISHYLRQKGYNVLHTMGWDTFGLPAENYAIKTGTPPAETTKTNVANFKRQLQQLGMSYDWSREITTTDPEYYKWTQWIFTQLYKNDLAYQAERAQWWCSKCKTVLANEQVVNGKCWRHDDPEDPIVTKKSLNQWFFKITDYADRLLDGIDELDWPEKIKTMQRNWIGKSHGMIFTSPVKDMDLVIQTFSAHFEAFAADTFVVIAPDHPLLKTLVENTANKDKVLEFANNIVRERDESGYGDTNVEGIFTGRYIVDPVGNGDLPIWVASYALADYGTGIVKCSAHDERDFKFAKKYDIPLKPVLFPADADEVQKVKTLDICFTDMKNGILTEPEQFEGKHAGNNRENIINYLEEHGLAERRTSYKIHDWLISRQRYWGSPIPIIHCEKDGAVSVPDEDLPVLLPDVESYAPTGDGSVLKSVTEWVNTVCPKCGGPGIRETDTMDGYACSSWYYLRYSDPHNDTQAWDPQVANYWLPIDYYCGGDHAVSHLLYSRFWMYFFAEQGWIEKTKNEPVGKLVYNGYILAEDGNKMSKSKGNVVNPDALIELGYGADAVRLFEMFIAPYEQNTRWNTNGVPGTFRFLQRFWTLVQEYIEAPESEETDDPQLLFATHKAIKTATTDLDELRFNTAVSNLMEAVNSLYKCKASCGIKHTGQWKFALESLTQLIAPFAPHITEEIWEQLGYTSSIHSAKWPEYNETILETDTMKVVVQVNGKVRATIELSADASEEDVIRAAQENEKVAEFISDNSVKKSIYVPKKLVNFVV